MGKSCRKWLAEQATTATRIVEVGVWLGRSTTVLCKATKGKVWAVDHWRGTPADSAQHDKLYAAALAERDPFTSFSKNLAGPIAVGKVIPVKMGSVAAARKLRSEFGPRSFDFVFIDADHSYDGCKSDIRAWLPMVEAGGLLAGHDFHWPGVAQAVTERFGDDAILGPGSIWSVRT